MKTKDLDTNTPGGGRQGNTPETPPTQQTVPEGEPEGRPDADPTPPPGDPPTAAEIVVEDPQTVPAKNLESGAGKSGRARSMENLLKGHEADPSRSPWKMFWREPPTNWVTTLCLHAA